MEKQLLMIILPSLLALLGSGIATFHYLKYTTKAHSDLLKEHEKQINELYKFLNRLDKLLSNLITQHRINHPTNPDLSRNGGA